MVCAAAQSKSCSLFFQASREEEAQSLLQRAGRAGSASEPDTVFNLRALTGREALALQQLLG